MKKVQSYIANVSFPTSLEEMEELVNGEYYMDMEVLLLFDDASFTAPKWATKGDIVFFYHAKSAITKIRHLKSSLEKEKDKYILQSGKMNGKNIKDNYCVLGTNANNLVMRTSKRNTSGHKGVYWDKRRQKWKSQIRFSGKNYYLGRYKNKEDAITARENAEKHIFGTTK